MSEDLGFQISPKASPIFGLFTVVRLPNSPVAVLGLGGGVADA